IQGQEQTLLIPDPPAWILSFQFPISQFLCGYFFDSIDPSSVKLVSMQAAFSGAKSSVGGPARPSALAVLRLPKKVEFVGRLVFSAPVMQARCRFLFVATGSDDFGYRAVGRAEFQRALPRFGNDRTAIGLDFSDIAVAILDFDAPMVDAWTG